MRNLKQVLTLIASLFSGLGLLSRVHPLIYLVAYLLCVPVFALIYENIPDGFYAPYAHLERAGQSDAYNIGTIIQSALRAQQQRMRTRQSSGDTSNLVIRDGSIYVQRLSSVDGSSISFDVLVLIHDQKTNGDMQFQVPVVMQRASRIIIGESDRAVRNLRSVDLGNISSYPADFRETVSATFLALFARWDGVIGAPSIEVSADGDATIQRYFEGLSGDPLSIGDSYLRMLYFSAIVITTVGFGDIVPMSPLSRGLVGFEAVLGVVLAGLFLNAVAHRAARRG